MQYRIILILAVWLHVTAAARAGGQTTLDGLADLPEEHRGAFAGISGDALVVAGGHDGQGAFSRRILVLKDLDAPWQEAGELAVGLADGAAASARAGVVIAGGWDGQRERDEVSLLRFDRATGEVQVSALPPLPAPRRWASAAAIGDVVYVAGGIGPDGPATAVWSLDLGSASPAWRELRPWPCKARSGAALIPQNDGQHTSLFLIGGLADDGAATSEVHAYAPGATGADAGWRRLDDLPVAIGRVAAVASGQSHILLFADAGDQAAAAGRLLLYHTITRTCIEVDRFAFGLGDASAVHWRGRTTLIGAAERDGAVEVVRVEIPAPPGRFGPLDYSALVLYLALITGIGLWFARSEKSTGEFFLAGKRIPWWAAALSLMATQVSSIGFMAIPAKTFATDWSYFTGVWTWFIAVPIVTAVFIPFYRRLNVTSAYEYLEARFNVAVRMFAAGTFCLMQIGRSAVVLYLPALALAAVTGLDLFVCIIVMGVLATAYTVAGGMAAVIWTDVIQAGVLLGGALLCVAVVIFSLDGGPGQFVQVAWADSKFEMIHLRWDFASTALWVVIVGNAFSRLAIFTSDQAVVQRYLTTRDTKQAQRALWGDVAVSIPWAIVVFMLGTALYVYYKTDPTALNPAVDVDGIVPFFIAQQLPTGISGLIIAAVFAAAMSSLDSSIHSVATVMVTDFYKRFAPRSSDRQRLLLARLVTLAMGAFATGMAIMLAVTDIRSIWDFYMGLLGLFVGVIAGFFMLGIFSTRASGAGAVIGGGIGAAVVYWVQAQTTISFFLYPAIAILATFATGYFFSLIIPGAKVPLHLTMYSGESDSPARAEVLDRSEHYSREL